MIVEDDPMVREINSKFLNKIEGFELCASVSNLEDAKKKILRKKPDLILLDVYLPKENGIDLIHIFEFENLEKWKRKLKLYFENPNKFEIFFKN